MKTIDVVCGAFIHDGQILIARRKSSVSDGIFEFPGGKVEPGESLQDALKREWMEECGVEIEKIEPFMVSFDQQKDTRINLHSFICTAKSRPVSSSAHDMLVWTTPDHIYDYPFFESDRPLVEKLQADWDNYTKQMKRGCVKNEEVG